MKYVCGGCGCAELILYYFYIRVVCVCHGWVIHIVYVSFIVSLSRMSVSFIMSVSGCGGSFRVSESFN